MGSNWFIHDPKHCKANQLPSLEHFCWFTLYNCTEKSYFHKPCFASAWPGPVFCLLLGVSSDYAQPITGQVTEVTCPVIGRAQPELTQSKRQKTGPDEVLTVHRGNAPQFSCILSAYHLTNLPRIKWPPFCRRQIQMHFHVWKLLYFDSNFTEIYS